jgi:hypothetical protein
MEPLVATGWPSAPEIGSSRVTTGRQAELHRPAANEVRTAGRSRWKRDYSLVAFESENDSFDRLERGRSRKPLSAYVAAGAKKSISSWLTRSASS